MTVRVLLVDDDEFARSYARTVLERAGFEVAEAETVETAMTSASSFHPAAVVTDWNLPDGDGGALARNLHSISERLPVILITGDAGGIELPAAGKQNFAMILEKPFMPSALENAVRDALLH